MVKVSRFRIYEEGWPQKISVSFPFVDCKKLSFCFICFLLWTLLGCWFLCSTVYSPADLWSYLWCCFWPKYQYIYSGITGSCQLRDITLEQPEEDDNPELTQIGNLPLTCISWNQASFSQKRNLYLTWKPEVFWITCLFL